MDHQGVILLAEDSQDDAFLIQKALEKSSAVDSVHHVRDGHEAILYLSRAMVSREVARPALVLLDINLPRQDGLEVLTWIRTQRAYQGLPVVILTSSRDPSNVQRAKKLGAHSYLMKSANFQEVFEFVEKLFAPNSTT